MLGPSKENSKHAESTERSPFDCVDFVVSGTLHSVDQGLEITLAAIMNVRDVTLMQGYRSYQEDKFT